MTVSYQLLVANANLANFAKLLVRWRGSIYKLFFQEFLVYGSLYTLFSLLYRYVFDTSQRKTFELFCMHIDETISHIPLTFVLGFYVSLVVNRWWDQLNHYPWPDRMLYLIVHFINGSDEKSRMMRRTLVRYLNVTITLLTRNTSLVTKKRFPTLQHLVDAGLLTQEELKLYEDVKLEYGKFWVPLVWFSQLVNRAKEEGILKDTHGAASKLIMGELMAYRSLLGKLFLYDWVSIPICYTQVVTLATYAYFLGCIFARQFLDPTQKYKGHNFDMYVPVFSVLQFMFYMGWLKVAESLINPWGEDDDDFEVNWFIDRHLQVSFAVVDDMHNQTPSLVRDKYWGGTEIRLPYTIETMGAKRGSDFADLGSVAQVDVPLDRKRTSLTVPHSRRESLANGNNAVNALHAFRTNIEHGMRKRSIHIHHKPSDMDVIVESPSPDKLPGGLNWTPEPPQIYRNINLAERPLSFIDSSRHGSRFSSREHINQLPPNRVPELDRLLEQSTPSSPDSPGTDGAKTYLIQKLEKK